MVQLLKYVHCPKVLFLKVTYKVIKDVLLKVLFPLLLQSDALILSTGTLAAPEGVHYPLVLRLLQGGALILSTDSLADY